MSAAARRVPWLVAATLAASTAIAQSAGTLDVVLADDDAALTALAAPAGTVAVCAGSTCPSSLDRVDAENVRVGTDARRITVDADVRVTATLPLVGSRTTTLPVHCDGEPELDAASVLHLRDVDCNAGSVPGISSALGALLARDLEARTVDVGREIRGGALERHSADRRLTRTCAAACVSGSSLVQPLESSGHAHVVLRVSVGPASCCP